MKLDASFSAQQTFWLLPTTLWFLYAEIDKRCTYACSYSSNLFTTQYSWNTAKVVLNTNQSMYGLHARENNSVLQENSIR
jgi:hypothetical protein